MKLHVERIGSGPPVLLVHGAVTGARLTWREQLVLAERWELHLVDRPGFGASPPVERVDFEVDAPLVAELLGRGAHLVGHSYGGVVSLLAAVRRPERVRSLTVIEPPAFAVARGQRPVERFVADAQTLWAEAPEEPERFLRRFLALVGSKPIRGRLKPELERGARLLRAERGPWEAEIPLEALAATRFPKLVVSGGHHAAFDAVCDVLVQRLGAERAAFPGAGHSVQRAGAPFNARLEAFLRSAERG